MNRRKFLQVTAGGGALTLTGSNLWSLAAPDRPAGLVSPGCRTKIDVRVDGDVRKLWQNWAHSLHRQTCYGDFLWELQTFCRFNDIQLVNEAV